MTIRLGLVTFAIVLSITAQTASESNSAYQRFRAARFTPEGVKAAEDWLLIYERQKPDPKNLPPYLDVARLYAERGVHMAELPALLDKALQEITTPGGFTDVFARTNSPFLDHIDRCLAANVYTQIHQYDKAHALVETVGKTVAETRSESLDQVKARIFEGLLFSYRDATVRLAVAEDRKEDALNVERAILTNPKNVASTRSLQEHRTIALKLWKDLGRGEDRFQTWLSTGH
jgi:hypothetical protein